MKLISKLLGKRHYRIRNKQGDFWSNEIGWIDLLDGTEFICTEEEKIKYNLPYVWITKNET